jgi:hypothetical protein
VFEGLWIRFKPAEKVVSRQKERMRFVKATSFKSAALTCNIDSKFIPIIQIYQAAPAFGTRAGPRRRALRAQGAF